MVQENAWLPKLSWTQGHLELKVHPPVGERDTKEVAAAMRKVIENAASLLKRKVD